MSLNDVLMAFLKTLQISLSHSPSLSFSVCLSVCLCCFWKVLLSFFLKLCLREFSTHSYQEYTACHNSLLPHRQMFGKNLIVNSAQMKYAWCHVAAEVLVIEKLCTVEALLNGGAPYFWTTLLHPHPPSHVHRHAHTHAHTHI